MCACVSGTLPPTVTPFVRGGSPVEGDRRILTLGSFCVLRAGAELVGLTARPLQAAVLAYIASMEEVTRSGLIRTFWPERAEARARHALSQVLHKLRRTLGSDWIRLEGEIVRLERGVTADALEFEAAVRAADAQAALTLYRGEFLSDLSLLQTQEWERWLDDRRRHLTSLFVDACRVAAERAERDGDLDAAASVLRRLTQADALDERAYFDLARVLVSAGRRAEAARCRDECLARSAADELGGAADLRARFDAILRPAGPGPAAMLGGSGGAESLGGIRPLATWEAMAAGRVLVLPLENLTGDPALNSLGRLVADWLTEGLDRAGIGRIVPLVDALRLRELAPASDDAARAAAGARDLAPIADGGIVIAGSCRRLADRLEFAVQVLDLRSGELLASIDPVRSAGTDDVGALGLLREHVVGMVAATLDSQWAGLPTAPESGITPPTYSAYRAYSTGVDHFLRLDLARAIPALREAIALDRTFTRPVFLAAAAHMNLGEWPETAALVQSLQAVGDRLSPYERNSLAWHEANLAGDRATAYQVSAQGARRYPGTFAQFVAGLDAVQVNRPREAIAFLRDLRPAHGWLRTFHLLWDVLTGALHMLGEHEAELRAADEARSHFPTLLPALACVVRALAPAGLGQELERLLGEAESLPPQPGWSPARVALLASTELRAHGHRADAVRLADRTHRALIGEPLSGTFGAASRTELARAHYLAEAWADAETVFAELAAQFPENVEFRGRLATLAARRGDGDAARARGRDLLELERPYSFGRITAWRARVAALLGDEDRAIRLLVRAFAEGRPFGPESHADLDLEGLRQDDRFLQFIRPRG